MTDAQQNGPHEQSEGETQAPPSVEPPIPSQQVYAPPGYAPPGHAPQGYAPQGSAPASQTYPQAGTPAPYPAYAPQFAPMKRPKLNTGLTRILGGLTIVAWLLVIAFGFLNFTLITPHASGVASTADGWGRWTHQGPALELYDGASASLLMVAIIPVILLVPTLLGAVFILCNVGRRAFFIVDAVFAALATAAIGYFVARPDDTTLVSDTRSNDYIMSHYDFATGAGGYLILVTCILVIIMSIAGAVLARTGPWQPAATTG
ncbi:hypothetical protein [Gordonia sp. (in: high G+C Gram-positive bacteria)]|uniref:hypothetical protein n=1 Tax=unclassified Gordonia (in: high G+C Gram-positive bacteria) TaxID=2657482 RepID=UPI003528A98B